MGINGWCFYDVLVWILFVVWAVLREDKRTNSECNEYGNTKTQYYKRILYFCKSSIMTILEQHNDNIQKLCASHRVKSLYAFGSVLGKFNNDSDVDLIVDFENIDVANYADNYFDLKFSLQDMLHRSIDLL